MTYDTEVSRRYFISIHTKSGERKICVNAPAGSGRTAITYSKDRLKSVEIVKGYKTIYDPYWIVSIFAVFPREELKTMTTPSFKVALNEAAKLLADAGV